MGKLTGRLKRAVAMVLAASMVLGSFSTAYAAGDSAEIESIPQEAALSEQENGNEGSGMVITDDSESAIDDGSEVTDRQEADAPEEDAKDDPEEQTDGEELSEPMDGAVLDDTPSEDDELFLETSAGNYKTVRFNMASIPLNSSFDIQYSIDSSTFETLTDSSFRYPQSACELEILITEKDSSKYGFKGVSFHQSDYEKIYSRAVNGTVDLCLDTADLSNTTQIAMYKTGRPFPNEFAIESGSENILTVEERA